MRELTDAVSGGATGFGAADATGATGGGTGEARDGCVLAAGGTAAAAGFGGDGD